MTKRKKIICWTAGIIASPFLLFLLLAILLYVPPIQNWAVKQATAYASRETGYEIGIDHVRLSFPLDLKIEGLKAIQPNKTYPQLRDTLTDARQLYVSVSLLPLFSGEVDIDELDFRDVQLNTADLIASARVKGRVGRLALQSHGIDLGASHVQLDDVLLSDSQIDVALSDSVPEDTTESQSEWVIALQQLKVERTAVKLHMPGDTLQASVYLGAVNTTDGTFDLKNGAYRLQKLEWKDGTAAYDNRFETRTKGLDVNHISLSDIALRIDSLDYSTAGLQLALRYCRFKEQSGLAVSDISGQLRLDSTKMVMPTLRLQTPNSQLAASIDLDLNAFDEQNPGRVSASLDGSFGKQDLLFFMGDMPQAFRQRWPNQPLSIRGAVKGNMQLAEIVGLTAKLPTAFSLSADGWAANLTDMDALSAKLHLDAKTYDLGFVTAMLPASVTSQVRIPQGIGLTADVTAKRQTYDVAFRATEGGGSLSGRANYDMRRAGYTAELSAKSFPIAHFLPGYGLSPFSGQLTASGQGTDFLSPSTTLTANAEIGALQYAGYDLSGARLTAEMGRGVGHVVLDSHNPLLDGTIDVNALLSTKRLSATVTCDLVKADLYQLQLTKRPFSIALCGTAEVESDMANHHSLQCLVGDVVLRDSARTYQPEDISLDVFTNPDSTHAIMSSGDFSMHLDAQGYYEALLSKGDVIMTEMSKQQEARVIDQKALRALLPTAHFSMETGRENMLVRALKYFGYDMAHATIDMDASPTAGLNGSMQIDSLGAMGVQLDTVRLALRSDSVNTFFNGQIRNNRQNPQYVFNAKFGGTFFERGIYFGTRIYDENERLGVALGMSAAMVDDGIQLSLGKKNPILGYKEFKVNDDNYMLLRRDGRVSADLSLRATDGMAVQIYTNDETDALQDLTIGLTKFELDKVLSVIPYMPQMSGTMNGDFHVIQTTDQLSVSSSIDIDKLVYEHCPMGDISTEFVYMPKDDGSHYVDGTLSCNNYQVGAIKGTYSSEGEGYLDASLDLNRTPLQLINGFVPDQLIGLKGYAQGTLSVVGTLSKPNVNGEVVLDSAYIASEPYGVELRFDNRPITISNSHLVFEDFTMYSRNDSPLTITGYYDFSDLDNMYVDLRMRATNYLLIDAKENRRSETYGKAYVNFFGRMQGPVASLSMRGKLDVLGSTDMTYILRDSPLTTDNQLEGLVKFVDFKDTETQTITRPPLTGLSVDLSISIDEGAHILCALNTDQSNYVDLIGGGDLRMQYNTTDNLQLRGRYTLSDGEMKYSLPVIPLKTFTIQDGSYVEFTGDPMNPRLNITATEQNKANVTSGGSSRTVEFECGVVVTKTLNDMGLEFIIDAPEDMTIHNELQTMSVENRGKIAVTMLTTGMYLTSGNTNSFSMNSALTAFLNSQINAISGNALRTLDLSFGVDNSTTSTGQTHTDYSFKFAKRFWNNRLRIVIGGKVSSGAEVQNQNNTFFDNVTFEYRLSQNSNKYLKLFYERDSYDWLEGNVEEYGGGFIWRRKLQHFRDIFRFRSDKQTMPAPVKTEPDSLTTTK